MDTTIHSTMNRGLLLAACALFPAILPLVIYLAEFSAGVSLALLCFSGAVLIASIVAIIVVVRKFDIQEVTAIFSVVFGLTVLITFVSIATESLLQNDFLTTVASTLGLSLSAIFIALYVRLVASGMNAFRSFGKGASFSRSSEISLALITIIAGVIALSHYNFEIPLRQAARWLLLIAFAPWCLSLIYDGLVSLVSGKNFNTAD